MTDIQYFVIYYIQFDTYKKAENLLVCCYATHLEEMDAYYLTFFRSHCYNYLQCEIDDKTSILSS